MEHKSKDGMMDNRKVSDSHQEGINRVKMRKGDLVKGQGGKLTGHSYHSEGSHFNRDKSGMTPKKA